MGEAFLIKKKCSFNRGFLFKRHILFTVHLQKHTHTHITKMFFVVLLYLTLVVRISAQPGLT